MQEILEKETAHNGGSKEKYRTFLKDNALFDGFSEECLDMLFESSHVRKVKKGKVLFFTGDKADFFYIVVNGWVKLFRETRDGHETIIDMLSHGDMFGRSAVLKNGFHPYSGQAATEVELFIIPCEFMLFMADNHRSFDHFLSKFLESERNEYNQKGLEVEHLAHMPSAERVGCFLLKMCGHRRAGSHVFAFPYGKSLVAGRLGMTPETFSRSLNQLGALGVEVNNSEVTIHNIEQLQSKICDNCSALKRECAIVKEAV